MTATGCSGGVDNMGECYENLHKIAHERNLKKQKQKRKITIKALRNAFK